MDTNELNNKIIKILKNEVKEVNEDTEKLIEEIKKLNENSLGTDIDLLESYMKIIVRYDCIKDAQNVFRTITIVSNIESELDILNDSISALKNQSTTSIGPGIQSIIQGLIGSIKSKIKRISARLWQFLSQMMNLNEWSVSGNANLNICGFSGGVTLQLTFGT